MKAIIIAAGMGKRMKEMTEDIPKCLLEFEGRTLLDIQLEAFRENGITDISIVVGYKKEKINYPELKYYVNEAYEKNNILNSLFYAEKELNDDVIVTYCDIIFDEGLIKKVKEEKEDFSVVVDMAWRDAYIGRNDHPVEEAENVIFDENGKVVEIGKIITNKEEANGEFIGMFKLSKKGCEVFKEKFLKARELYWGKEWITANTFENAYVTDMVQHLVNEDIEINCTLVKGGWAEIDTVEDYKRSAGKI